MLYLNGCIDSMHWATKVNLLFANKHKIDAYKLASMR